MAEGVGFEPTRACALPVFKTGAINHSTTPPDGFAPSYFGTGVPMSKTDAKREKASTVKYVHVNL